MTASSWRLASTNGLGQLLRLRGQAIRGEPGSFGEGIGIAVRRGNDTLRLALNWSLFRLWGPANTLILWLRSFPSVHFDHAVALSVAGA